jgi:hypothetical protein
MARLRTGTSLDEVIRAATAPVVVRASNLIARAVADLVAAQLEVELKTAAPRARGFGRSRSRTDMTKWSADRRARRVPNFVIEMTGGLKTKKQIVAKFGENATFENGKPLPAPTKDSVAGPGGGAKAAREVKAKPPTVRRKVKRTA